MQFVSSCLHLLCKKEDNSALIRFNITYCYTFLGAKRCIRSAVSHGTLAAQNCCYDSKGFLITRGSGAGTPHIISPDVSEALHQLVDKVPWILCKGDWTKYVVAKQYSL